MEKGVVIYFYGPTIGVKEGERPSAKMCVVCMGMNKQIAGEVQPRSLLAIEVELLL